VKAVHTLITSDSEPGQGPLTRNWRDRGAIPTSPRKPGEVRAAAQPIAMHAAAAGGLDICPAVNRVDRIDRAIHQVKNIMHSHECAGSILRVMLNLAVLVSHDLHPL
jgi:hypothetical protein